MYDIQVGVYVKFGCGLKVLWCFICTVCAKLEFVAQHVCTI